MHVTSFQTSLPKPKGYVKMVPEVLEMKNAPSCILLCWPAVLPAAEKPVCCQTSQQSIFLFVYSAEIAFIFRAATHCCGTLTLISKRC